MQKSIFRISITVLFSLLFLMCQQSEDRDSSKERTVLKIGYLAHPGYLPLFCADDQGRLHQEDIEMQLVRFESSPAMISAFVNDEIQVAPLATVSALSLESLDPGRFRVFALSSETVKNFLTAIVTLPPQVSNIATLDDLKGEKIGIFPGPAARTLFTLVFEKHGLFVGQDVFFQELAPPLHLQALASKQVAAIATYEPIATQAVVELNAVKLMPAAVETHVLTPTQGGSWLISSNLVNQNSYAAFKVVDAIEFGIDFIEQNSDSLPGIISKYTSVSLDVALQAPLVTYSKLENIDLDSYQKHADLMFENGILSRKIEVSKLMLEKNNEE